MQKNLDKLLEELLYLHPKYIDLSLNRLFKLLFKIDNPHLKLPPIIHIAGTNGKGSTLSYIRHILMEGGYNVHAYISPHLKLFNERIIINNNQIGTQKLITTLKFIKKINQNNPITFFEITTAAAFYLFAKEKTDFLILETGLGGRLDATNVVNNSLINIITPISIDHQEFLGKNINNITNEKLGIIKKESTVIISKQSRQVELFIKKKLLNKKNNKIFYNNHYKIMKKNNNTFTLKYKKEENIYKVPKLIGDHQIENASTAIATILNLNEIGYKFSNRTINNGILKTKWPGRLELGKLNNIKVYMDGAHNIDGASKLLKYFKNKKIKVWLMMGMLKNKDLYGFVKKLKPITKGIIAIKIPKEKNSFLPNDIERICNELKIINYKQTSIKEANNFIINELKPKVILVTGSLYLIGKIRKYYL